MEYIYPPLEDALRQTQPEHLLRLRYDMIRRTLWMGLCQGDLNEQNQKDTLSQLKTLRRYVLHGGPNKQTIETFNQSYWSKSNTNSVYMIIGSMMEHWALPHQNKLDQVLDMLGPYLSNMLKDDHLFHHVHIHLDTFFHQEEKWLHDRILALQHRSFETLWIEDDFEHQLPEHARLTHCNLCQFNDLIIEAHKLNLAQRQPFQAILDQPDEDNIWFCDVPQHNLISLPALLPSHIDYPEDIDWLRSFADVPVWVKIINADQHKASLQIMGPVNADHP